MLELRKSGHSSQDCKAPRVELSMRPCWTCGECGHVSAKCPKKPAGQARNLQEALVPPVLGFNMFEAVVHSTRSTNSMKTATEAAAARRPAPRGTTAGDYVKSALTTLAEADAEKAFGVDMSPWSAGYSYLGSASYP